MLEGTFAVVSLMVSKIVGQYSNDGAMTTMLNSTVTNGVPGEEFTNYEAIQVVTAVNI